MQNYVPSYQKIIDELNKLPGIGPKSAERIASYILRSSEEDFSELINSLIDGRKKIKKCKICFNLSEDELCDICKEHAVAELEYLRSLRSVVDEMFADEDE